MADMALGELTMKQLLRLRSSLQVGSVGLPKAERQASLMFQRPCAKRAMGTCGVRWLRRIAVDRTKPS